MSWAPFEMIAFFSLFMAVGNVLGFATGAYDNWGKWFPFTLSDACDLPCSNLKSAFLLGTILLIITTILSVTAATEIPWSPKASSSRSKSSSSSSTPLLGDLQASGKSRREAKVVGKLGKVEDPEDDDEQVSEALVWELLVALRDLPKMMWYILWVTALIWFEWFPFLLFDTDWMGREVYLGEPTGSETSRLSIVYYAGGHMGALGLMLNSVVLGLSSLLIYFMCRKIGPLSRLWGLANAIMAICFASTETFLKKKDIQNLRMPFCRTCSVCSTWNPSCSKHTLASRGANFHFPELGNVQRNKTMLTSREPCSRYF